MKDDKENLYLYWWDAIPNFGDILSPYIAQKLTKRQVESHIKAPPDSYIYFGIGSILLAANSNSIVWGVDLWEKYILKMFCLKSLSEYVQ